MQVNYWVFSAFKKPEKPAGQALFIEIADALQARADAHGTDRYSISMKFGSAQRRLLRSHLIGSQPFRLHIRERFQLGEHIF